jgi:purine nucleosidase
MKRLPMTGRLALLLAAATAVSTPALAAPSLAIIDNDWSAAGGAMAVMPLIADPDVKILGLTAVIGDGYVNDSIAHTLRFLEIIHRPEIPMIPGANTPLIRTKAELNGWEKLYGPWPYKGAWADPKPGQAALAPDGISPMIEGETRLKPAKGVAAEWLVEQVNAHPGAISILAAGPLTNLALAVRLDPSFASKVKSLVIMGGMVDNGLDQIRKDADFYSDFNFQFDPEAADIVLTAGFPKVVILGNVTNETMLTKPMVDRVAAKQTPLTAYYARHAWVGLPLWDELAAAVMADPSLIVKSTDAYMRINLDRGLDYGRAHVFADKTRPHTGEQKVTVVDKVDVQRFYDDFTRALQAPLPK